TSWKPRRSIRSRKSDMNLQMLGTLLGGAQSIGQTSMNDILSGLAFAGNAINYGNAQGLVNQEFYGGQGPDTPFGRIPFGPQGGGTIGQVQQLAGGLAPQYANLAGQSNQFNENIRQGTWQNYNNLLSGALNTLQGSGDQERADINTQFNNLGAQAGSDMINR